MSREEFIEKSNARIKELKRVINYKESLRPTGLKGLGSDESKTEIILKENRLCYFHFT